MARLSSHRPLGLKFLSSITLITLCAIAFLYYLLSFYDRPPPAQPLLPTKIPEILWYKLGPSGLNDQAREWTDSCIKNNPNYRSEFMTDATADAYVAKAFASRPDVVETYLNLTIPILKADFLRYLLLLDQGGVWSDLDVSCQGVPIDEWIPAQYKSKASLVVGWEFDVGWGSSFVRQFATWTIMAKPGLRHMSMVVEDILQGLYNETVEHNVSLADLTLAMTRDVVDMTGPRRFTFSVLKSLERTLNTTVSVESISKLREPKLVSDVLIMPGSAFAASSNKYKNKEGLSPPLVTHHYAGTWKNEHGGEEP